MRCFHHAEVDAVAVCKHCGRALCHDCLVESDAGISCSGRCAKQVQTVQKIIEQSRPSLARTGQAYLGNALFPALAGLALLGFGLAFDLWILGSVGLLFLLWSVVTYRVGKREL